MLLDINHLVFDKNTYQNTQYRFLYNEARYQGISNVKSGLNNYWITN